MTRIFIAIFSILFFCVTYAQGPSLSPYELKESFFEKKNAALKSTTKTIAADDQIALDRIETILFENAPNSYEYNLVKYENNKYAAGSERYLLKAAALKPGEKEVNAALYSFYVRTNNLPKRKEYANLLQKNLSTNVRIYTKAIVNSTHCKILVFSGDEDAIPFLILQDMGQIKADIEVIVLDFMADPIYWGKLGQKYKLGNLTFENNEATLMKILLTKNSAATFVSTTVHHSYLRLIANQTVLVGLTYQYNCPDQVGMLSAFRGRANIDLKGISLEGRTDKAKFSNYLPPLLTLYKIQIAAGNKDLVLRKELLDLAERLSKKEFVISILKEYDQLE